MNSLTSRFADSRTCCKASRSWIYLLLCLFLWGCSAAPGPQAELGPEQVQDTGTQISQPFTPVPQYKPASDRASSEQDTPSQPQDIEFRQQDPGSCLLLIPASSEVQVQAEYEHPRLRLNFSPDISRPDLPETPDFCPASQIELLAAESGKIEALELKLQEPVQFLVSRSDSGRIRLALISDSQQQAGQQSSAEQDSSNNKAKQRLELQDLDFSLDQENRLRIALQASGPIQYQPQPQEDREIRLSLPRLTVPQDLDKHYNLEKFEAAAKSLWLEDTESGSELRISLKARVPFNVQREEDQLLITFQEGEFNPGQEKEQKQPELQQPEPKAAMAQGNQLSPEQIPDPEAGLQDAGLDSAAIFPGMGDQDYQGEPISIDLQDAEVEHVLRLIAEVGDFNLVLDEEVQGRISLKLTKVPWDQALDLVLMQKDLGRVRKGNIMRIASADKLDKEQQRVIQARKSALEAKQSQQDIAPLQTEYVQINYATADELKDQVENFLSERGEVSVDSRTNQLIVRDTAAKLEQIQGMIQKLDRPERQVLIQARLVHATDIFTRSLGIKWGQSYSGTAQGGDLEYGIDSRSDGYMVNLPQKGDNMASLGLGAFMEKTDIFRLDAQLSLGEQKEQAQIISSPRVLTLTNQEAEIEQGTSIAVNRKDDADNTITEYVNALLRLTVTPQITPDDKIILDLDITDDQPGEGDDIDTKRTQTKLIVDNGQTIVLGGVQTKRKTNDRNRVPGLADLPLLGHLFKNRYRQQQDEELLIFIQPRIVETR
ncbi:MAG: type IV pilus secretin PilQ [Desulfohalobiaceae bacterium]